MPEQTPALYTLRKPDCRDLNALQSKTVYVKGTTVPCTVKEYSPGHMTVTIQLDDVYNYAINGVRHGKPGEIGRWHEA